ncbi:MAG TPA: type II secretion system F family protein [bacterium]|nr:type II secretion system F family protein [bacterium]
MEYIMCCACAGAFAVFIANAALNWGERAFLWRSIAPRAKGFACRLESRLNESGSGGSKGSVHIELASAAIGSLWALALVPTHPVISMAAGAVLGRFAPGLWLRLRRRRRIEEFERALPNFLDWLALSVEAGEGFAQALSRVAAYLPAGPLREELARLNADIRMGVTRKEALSSMAGRSGSRELGAVVALLAQADVLGVGVGPILRASSVRLRAGRLARAERRGVAAAQKCLLPLVFCIMPVTFVVIFGPLIARMATWGVSSLF